MSFLKKILRNSMGLVVLFLLLFIPLYPKLPLIDIRNTWVYVRAEDFVVLTTLVIWLVLLIRRKVTIDTPLTIPILAYWIVGAIATIHGVVIIFPETANVFPNVALFSYIRHIEYLSLFFIAFSAVRSRKYLIASVWTIIVALVGVVAYGLGQRFLSFPAYLTMNEEYAKGIPIIISPLNRISSTFAGHYDLAAYLVFVIPIVVSLAFGFRNWFVKIGLILVSLSGVALMIMTVSRVSFFVLFVALFLVLYFHKKKWVLYSIPLLIIAGGVFFYTQSSLLSRFGNTVEEVEVLVDAKTGADLGQVKFKPREYLYDKNLVNEAKNARLTPAQLARQAQYSIDNDIPPHLSIYMLPKEVPVVEAEITSTGETLPQGSSYINLSLSPVTERLNTYYFELPLDEATTSATVRVIPGEYLVKRASAYDLSFTTRFQGEWPNAIKAFTRNIFFGSGYGSVSLAVDNNYYRMLGETGLLGIASFLAIFLIIGSYIRKVLPNVDSGPVRSLAFGFSAGVIGLSLNAILIDVFEASKVAFVLWLTAGIVIGGLSLYQVKRFNVYREASRILTSPYAVGVYLFLLVIAIFSVNVGSYFIGDDFTWFKWASECDPEKCNVIHKISQYFLNSEGFFYRPGTKTYFLLMFPVFWLNQVVYHAVSIALHFVVVILLYFLSRKILKNELLAAAAASIFVIISGYLEVVLWIASTGHLINAIFILLSLLFFIKWFETKNLLILIASLFSALVSLAFHELGIITPLLALSYVVFKSEFTRKSIVSNLKSKIFILLFIPQVTYLVVRYFSHTHWFNGDYSYNLLKLPLNVVGNSLGYVLITIFGPIAYPIYESTREIVRQSIPVAAVLIIVFGLIFYFIAKYVFVKLSTEERKVALFACLFFMVSLVPFLGLGNITFRYSYLASFGVIIILVMLGQKTYKYLAQNGRDIGFFGIAMLLSVFSLVHIVQAQQAIIDWVGAGEKVERFLVSVDSLYQDEWTHGSPNFYFANVPVKNNNAWVFPVGIEDALWFAFSNERITVNRIGNVNDLDKSVYEIKGNWVFEFQGDGSIKEKGIEEDEDERIY